MSDFSANTDKMKSIADLIEQQARKIETLAQSVDDVRSKLGSSIQGEAGNQVKRALNTNSNNVQRGSKDVRKMASVLRDVAKTYRDTENKILGEAIRRDQLGNIISSGKGGGNSGTEGQKGNNKNSGKYTIDPVNLNTGNFILDNHDMEIPGEEPLVFGRFYNSMGLFSGMLGNDWNTSFETRLVLNPSHNISGSDICIILEDGKEERFIFVDKKYRSAYGTTAELEKTEEGYIYRSMDGDSHIFDQLGNYVRHENAHHIGFDLVYEDDRLVRVEKDSGEFYQFSYNEDGKLAKVEDHTGRSCLYTHENGHLTKVTLPEGAEFTYTYGAYGKLSGVKNARNVGAVETEYDSQFRVTYQKFADGTSNVFEYNDAERSVIMTERNGEKSVHFHDERFQNTRNVYSDGEEIFEYNDYGMKTKITDKAGNVTRILYDNNGNVTGILKDDGTKWFATYNHQNRLVTMSVNGEMRMRNVYNDYGDLLSTEDGIGRKTEYEYDQDGHVIRVNLPGGTYVGATYDARGNLTQLETEEGNVQTLEYDELNRPVKYTDAAGNQTQYQYDRCGRVTRETRPDGTYRSYEYDASGNVVLFTDYDGNTVKTKYNENNRPIARTDALGRTTEYEYDSMWNVSKVFLPGGAIFAYLYNKENRLESIRDVDGNEIRYSYDALGNVLSETDPSGNTIHYEYDSEGRCTKRTMPNGAVFEFGYDAEDHEIYRKDPEGIELFRTYDASGQLTEEKDSLGQKRSYEYDGLGRLIAETDEKGNATRYHYSGNSNQQDAVTFPNGTTERYEYDKKGNLISYIDPLGKKLGYTYDQLDRLIRLSDEQGTLKEYSYDPMGRLLSEADDKGNTTRYTYTSMGQLSELTSPAGAVTRYVYDEADQLVEVIRQQDDDIAHYYYERDFLGQITRMTDALGNSESYKYDGAGRIISKVDREGIETAYTYDSTGMLHSVRWADGRETSYTYNLLRRLTEVDDWTGKTSFSYDPLGNVTRIVYPDAREALFDYDQHGNRTQARYPDGTQVSYQYDALDRMTGVHFGDMKVAYEYNSMGQVTRRSLSDQSEVAYSYDSYGMLSGMKHSDAQGIADELTFGYDRYGRRETFSLNRRDYTSDNGSYRYNYDPEGQITEVYKENQLLRSYTYDAMNRRTGMEVLDPASGQPVKTEYQYNPCGALTAMIRPDLKEEYNYDRRGNLISLIQNGSRTVDYTYDALNRLTKVKNNQGQEAEYRYNGLGYRIGMQTKADGAQKDISYALDYSKIYDNLLEQKTEESLDNYIWGMGLEGNQKAGQGAGWYLTDPLGSVLLRKDTQGPGYAANYDEYGNSRVFKGQDIFGYNGFQADPIAGTYFAQARQYRSYTGTFDAMDRFGGDITMPSTINPYIYCVNSPFVHTDKSAYWFGLDDAIAAGIGAVGGLTGTLIGDVVEGVTTGKWDFKWQEYAGSAIGGAAGGVTTLYAGPIAGGAVAGGVSRLSTEGLNYVSDPKGYNKSIGDVAKETLIDTVIGGVSGAVSKGISKGMEKLAGTDLVKNLSSKLASKGKLGSLIAGKISDIAAGKSSKQWSQLTHFLKNQHEAIAKSPKLKSMLFSLLIKRIPVYIGQEVLGKFIDKIKPSKVIWNGIKSKISDKVKELFGLKDKDPICIAVDGGGGGSW